MAIAPAIFDKKECQVNVVENWFSVQNITSEKEDPNEGIYNTGRFNSENKQLSR